MLRTICTRAPVQRLRESRLTYRGYENKWPCLLLGGFDKSRSIVLIASLLVRVWCFRKDLYKTGERPSTRNILLAMITGHTFDVEGVKLFSRRNSLRLWPYLACRQDHRRRPGARFLQKHLKWYITKLEQNFRVWPQELSLCFSKFMISVTLCQKCWSDLKILRMEI